MNLAYFWLASADLAVARVAERVRQGGHSIPEATIRQRHSRSVRNLFQLYLPLVDSWKVYDNSRPGLSQLVAKSDAGDNEKITCELASKQTNEQSL